jgi:hypothetical protein
VYTTLWFVEKGLGLVGLCVVLWVGSLLLQWKPPPHPEFGIALGAAIVAFVGAAWLKKRRTRSGPKPSDK